MAAKIFSIIPARVGSKGVPRKNIRLLNGKPLIAWTIGAALESGVIDRLVVSTEDAEIAEVARKYGAEVVGRPLELAGDNVKTEPVMIHALEEIEKKGFIPDYISLIQCTSPFLTAEVIRQAVAKLTNNPEKYDSCSTYYQPHYSFGWKKSDDGNDYFTSEYPIENRPRRQDMKIPYPYLGAGAFYIVKAKLFKETKNRYGGENSRITGIEMTENDALQIDSMDNFLLADILMKRKLEGK